MKKISGPALDAVMNEEIKFHPAKFKNLYRNWMENIKDWCISRQLWWGHRYLRIMHPMDRLLLLSKEDALQQFQSSDSSLKIRRHTARMMIASIPGSHPGSGPLKFSKDYLIREMQKWNIIIQPTHW
jgi:isoleucyl-tRNA synthetase